MEKLFFLGGLCRSGTTVLGSILNQNPDIYVNTTSPLVDVHIGIERHLNTLATRYTFNLKEVVDNFLKDSYKIYFKNIDKKYIIDNGRSWPGNITEIKRNIDPNPKVICTYRSVPEIVTSFLAMDKKDKDNAMQLICREHKLEPTVKQLAEIAWDVMSKAPFEALRRGLILNPENILLIEYHDFINNPSKTIDRVYDFLEIPKYEHTFTNIENTLKDPRDYSWGFADLHNIRSEISKTSLDPKETLGEELYEKYLKYDKLLFEGLDGNRLLK